MRGAITQTHEQCFSRQDKVLKAGGGMAGEEVEELKHVRRCRGRVRGDYGLVMFRLKSPPRRATRPAHHVRDR